MFSTEELKLSKTTDSKNRTEVRLPMDLKRDMRVYCAKNDLTMRECMISALREFIRSHSCAENAT
jgi:hypothetical protein